MMMTCLKFAGGARAGGVPNRVAAMMRPAERHSVVKTAMTRALFVVIASLPPIEYVANRASEKTVPRWRRFASDGLRDAASCDVPSTCGASYAHLTAAAAFARCDG